MSVSLTNKPTKLVSKILPLGKESSSPLFHCITSHSTVPRDKGAQSNQHRRHPSSTYKTNAKVED